MDAIITESFFHKCGQAVFCLGRKPTEKSAKWRSNASNPNEVRQRYAANVKSCSLCGLVRVS